MSKEDLSIALPTELVERAVRDKINASIAGALGDPTQLIESLVGSVLSQKVNEHGNVDRSSYNNNYDYLEVVASNYIRDAAKEALSQVMEENKPKVVAAIKKQLAKSPSKIADVLVKGMTDTLDCTYRNDIKISFNSGEE